MVLHRRGGDYGAYKGPGGWGFISLITALLEDGAVERGEANQKIVHCNIQHKEVRFKTNKITIIEGVKTIGPKIARKRRSGSREIVQFRKIEVLLIESVDT